VHRTLSLLVDAVLGTVRPFMVWNLFLAFVPLAIAIPLFRAGAPRTRGWLWWPAFVAWLAFLPNAPYVMTDVVHLVDDLQQSSRDTHAYVVFASYAVFVGLGLLSYAGSMWLFGRWLSRRGVRATGLLIAAVHLACAVGIYLGRFVRVNSWDIVLAPESVARSLQHLAHRFPVSLVAMTFVALVVSTFVIHTVSEKAFVSARAVWRRGSRRLHPPAP
jgi:uncharacterized membrane protein